MNRCRNLEALSRLTLRASGDWVRSVDPPQHVPYLSLLTGAGCPDEYLVSLEALLAGLAAQERLHPVAPAVLDMGCGSGVCALVAARVWPNATVMATDHLIEAIATTRMNAERLEAHGLIRPGAVRVAEPGDLFANLGDSRYDLIIFNAPWVAAPSRNRAETALCDGGQATVRRFLREAVAHLNPGGRLILGYANHSARPPWLTWRGSLPSTAGR